MAIQLPDLSLWAARILAECPLIERTGEAADLAVALEDGPGAGAPAAFVMPSADAADVAAMGLGSLRQRVTHTVDVAILIDNRKDPSGSEAISDLQAVREQIIAALLNWSPESIADPIQFTGGNMVSMDGAELWWVDTYQTTYFLRTP